MTNQKYFQKPYRYWWMNLRWNLYNVFSVWKARRQRKLRGWADCDTWNIDGWFLDVVPAMLRHLAENSNGYPMDFSPEEWAGILERIAWDLEALKRHGDKWYGTDTTEGLYTRERLDECVAEEAQAEAQVKAGLEAFKEYFFALWD